MTFFERYEQLCAERGYKPSSAQAAQDLGLNKGTMAAWRKSGKPPTSDVVVIIANAFGVSTDYLLDRTDDKLDYANPELVAKAAEESFGDFNGDMKKAVALYRATAEKDATRGIIAQYDSLDDIDRAKVEAFIQGLLCNEKYNEKSNRKKHA